MIDNQIGYRSFYQCFSVNYFQRNSARKPLEKNNNNIQKNTIELL